MEKADRTNMMRRLGTALFVALAFLAASAASAEESIDTLRARQAESVAEYERIAREMVLSKERLQKLDEEIDAVKKDNASLTAALIQAAKTDRKLDEDIDAIASRLDVLKLQQDDIRGSLTERRGVLTEVLAALQRMGLNPPPAILVRPEDALASVRSAILLGAVVPELRVETEILMTDLKELTRLTTSIETERAKLQQTVAEQVAEKRRLALLLEEKKRLQAEAEQRMEEERRKAAEMAERAGGLQELIAWLETELASAREAEERRKREEAESAAQAVPEDYRLGQPMPFADRRGRLALPVRGEFGFRFGDQDGTGGTVWGDILRTQSGAIVTAPADGTVLYAGPFRSYGQLLILNAGDGYHIVLAGLDRISVSLGQSVLAGEPIGAMGETRLASIASLKEGNAAPELYVEFRKNGKPVDPGPWWAESLSGRTGNDT